MLLQPRQIEQRVHQLPVTKVASPTSQYQVSQFCLLAQATEAVQFMGGAKAWLWVAAAVHLQAAAPADFNSLPQWPRTMLERTQAANKQISSDEEATATDAPHHETSMVTGEHKVETNRSSRSSSHRWETSDRTRIPLPMSSSQDIGLVARWVASPLDRSDNSNFQTKPN